RITCRARLSTPCTSANNGRCISSGMPPSTGHSDFLLPAAGPASRAPGRRPLLGILADVCAGLMLASFLPATVEVWLLAAWTLLALVAIPKLEPVRGVALHLLVILLAAAHGTLSAAPASPSHLL